ncbi:hypothetical protein BKA59DRAFT_516809 [Fusarium tricinctum]|uniref:Uncharacterized protein n=1 Tax=Fusarium tricinctum TaxID=61284 RepID=A0A8K0W7U5_9HYPO|nr:hypothetical protein BKA59DRAFT_516809 [Fusarium tricinctum]
MRGSCTDKNWASPECAMFCLGADRGGPDLISGVGRFNVLPSNPEVWATWNRKATQYAVVGTIFRDESTSNKASATATIISSATYTTSASITSASESAMTSSSMPKTTESSEAPSGLSTGAKAGIGAGIGVGAVLAVAVILLLWNMRRTRRAIESEKQLPPMYYNPTMAASWQQSHHVHDPKELQSRPPQELDGHQCQAYNVRVELPAHS